MSDATDDQELRNIFYVEANILLEEMRKDLSVLSGEQVPGSEAQDRSLVFQRLGRCAHTIKGSSGIVGLTDLQEIARAMEMIFKAAKDDRVGIDANSLTLLAESIDVCQRVLDGEEVVQHGDLLARLNSISNP